MYLIVEKKKNSFDHQLQVTWMSTKEPHKRIFSLYSNYFFSIKIASKNVRVDPLKI